MTSRLISVADVGKDVSSALGIPVVAPILTAIFSATKQALEHSQHEEDEGKQLNRICSESVAFAQKLDVLLNESDAADVVSALENEHTTLQRLLAEIESLHATFRKREGKLTKKRAAERKELSAKISAMKQLRENILILTSVAEGKTLLEAIPAMQKDLRAARSVGIDIRIAQEAQSKTLNEIQIHGLNMDSSLKQGFHLTQTMIHGLRRSNREDLDRDEEGYTYYHQSNILTERIVRYPTESDSGYEGVGWELARLSSRREPECYVTVKRYRKRNGPFQDFIRMLQNRSLRHGNLLQLWGYSRYGEPFIVFNSVLYTYESFQKLGVSAEWQRRQRSLRMYIQILAATTHLYRDVNKRISPKEVVSQYSLPLLDQHGSIKLDPEWLFNTPSAKAWTTGAAHQNMQIFLQRISNIADMLQGDMNMDDFEVCKQEVRTTMQASFVSYHT